MAKENQKLGKARPSKKGLWKNIIYSEESNEEEDYDLPPEPNITLIGENTTHLHDFDAIDKPFLQPDSENQPSLENKYHTACYLTSNLNCEYFLRNLKQKKFKIEYYDSPYHEFHVQSLFMKNVEVIEVTDVDLNLDFMFHMVENRNSLRFLTKIALRRCCVDADMLAIICPELEHAFNLVEIDLSENPIGDTGFKEVLVYLYDWTSLKNLILADTSLSYKSFEMLGGLYSSRRLFISKLDLSRNICNKLKSIKRLLFALRKQSAPLEELILTHCGFEGNEVALTFESSLKNLKHLKVIDLSFNLLREEGDIVPLGDLLMESNLQRLDLSFNLIKEPSAIALLNQIYSYPIGEVQKTLVMSNFSIPQRYPIINPQFSSRWDIIVVHAGIRSLALPEVDNAKRILVKRLNYLYKKGKPKKDIVVESLKESLPRKLQSVKVDDFKDALLGIPSDKIDVLLVQEIVDEFSGGGSRANAKEFINIYNELFSRKSQSMSNKKSVTSTGKKSFTESRNLSEQKIQQDSNETAEYAAHEEPADEYNRGQEEINESHNGSDSEDDEANAR